MGVSFRINTRWPNNPLLLPAEYYGITVPSGLTTYDIRVPKIVDVTNMSKLTRSVARGSSNGGLAILSGLVTPTVSVALSSPGQLTVQRAQGAEPRKNGPLTFQFQGGEIALTLELGVYLLNTVGWDPQGDDLQLQIFAEVYSHELLHVLDETNIVTKWLPPKLAANEWIVGHLARGNPFTYGTPSMSAIQTETEFRKYFLETLNTEVHNTWATESNRRAGIRDAPAQYAIVQNRLNDLRALQVNRPHH